MEQPTQPALPASEAEAAVFFCPSYVGLRAPMCSIVEGWNTMGIEQYGSGILVVTDKGVSGEKCSVASYNLVSLHSYTIPERYLGQQTWPLSNTNLYTE